METVTEALGLADQALATLEELTAGELTSAVVRDAAIKRFEYSYDTVWKAGREFLLHRYKLDRKSPTTVFRGFMDAGLIDPHFVRQLLSLGTIGIALCIPTRRSLRRKWRTGSQSTRRLCDASSPP